MVPTIYVFRDGEHHNKEDRLDYILKKKADEGVKFDFLLWDETNLFMNKQFLEGLSPNIKRPQFKPLQWSHHQKFIVIDDKHVFAGGVDFTTGRFDWHEHHVVNPTAKYWWGIDVYAPQVKKTTNLIKLSWTNPTSHACRGTIFRCLAEPQTEEEERNVQSSKDTSSSSSHPPSTVMATKKARTSTWCSQRTVRSNCKSDSYNNKAL